VIGSVDEDCFYFGRFNFIGTYCTSCFANIAGKATHYFSTYNIYFF